MSAVSIEPLREEDLEAAARLEALAFGELGALDVRLAHLREELVRPWARLRVARLSGLLVGFMLTWFVADEVHLLNVAVEPAQRRKGIGRALMDDLLREARTASAAKIFLEVRVSNEPAIRLYDSYGFERLGVRRRYYDDGEDALDMMRML